MFMSGTFRAESFCLCPSVCEESNRCPREIAETAYHPDRDINLLLRLADSKLNAQRIVADTVRFVASRSGDAAVFTVLSSQKFARQVRRLILDAVYRWKKKLARAREALAEEDDAEAGRMMRYVGNHSRRRQQEDDDDDDDEGDLRGVDKLASLEKQLETLKKQMMMMAEATKLSQQISDMDFSDEEEDFDSPAPPPLPSKIRKSSSLPVPPPPPPPPAPVAPPVSQARPPPPPPLLKTSRSAVSAPGERASSPEAGAVSCESLAAVRARMRHVAKDAAPGASTEGAKPAASSFCDQIRSSQRRMRKTDLARSPGGTPLQRNRRGTVDNAFHQEMLANALFKKFQRARPSEEDEDDHERDNGHQQKRAAPKHEPSTKRAPGQAPFHASAGLMDVLDDEWLDAGDKENALAVN